MNLFLIIWLAVTVLALVLLIVFRPDRHVTWLVIITSLTALAVWVSLPGNPGIHLDLNGDGVNEVDREIAIRQGLDLAGGLKVLLEADLPSGEEPSSAAMDEVRRIVENRVDSLGALEPIVQLQGNRRLIVELPGYEDPESAVSLIRQTALLEFVEFGLYPPPVGTRILTDYRQPGTGEGPEEEATPTVEEATAVPTPEGESTEAPVPEDEQTVVEEPVYHTVMTGGILQNATMEINRQLGTPVVAFQLTADGSQQFADYTSAHVYEYLGIVLDGVVISTPRIEEAITGGTGIIRGEFTVDEATRLATQLRYGALPVPLKVDSITTVGPTLGRISVEQSVRAGMIGIAVVLLFMLVYYRIPGVAAALALIVFALLNLMTFKLVPVTMTLPAITGFLISVGTAVDGNILIFERMKEELRAGKRISRAIEVGFSRAWTSIRDSNISTLIICAVLYAFGTSFGANAVRGFAVTLALGLVINLFTAVTVTHTFLHFIMMPLGEEWAVRRRWMLGL